MVEVLAFAATMGTLASIVCAIFLGGSIKEEIRLFLYGLIGVVGGLLILIIGNFLFTFFSHTFETIAYRM